MPLPNVIDTEKLSALGLTLIQLDPDTMTQADWEALAAINNCSRAESWPDDPPRPVDQTIKNVTSTPPFVKASRWAVKRGAELVAHVVAAYLEMESNQHIAQFNLYVVPEIRRQGVGSELLKLAEFVARNADRRLLMTDSDSAMPAGEAFLEKIGGQMGLAGVTNQLDIADLDRALLQQWQERAKDRAADLDFGFWDGPYPEADIQAICTMKETMNTQPLDDMDLEDMTMTPEMLRQIEETLAARGVTRWTMYVRNPANGEFAGYTETFWNPNDPETLQQGDTAVVPAYRNRGLGRWLKAAMLDKVLQERPQLKRARTGNAQSNDAMLKINHDMGFKPYKTESLWQIPLEKVQAYLNARGA